MRHSASAEIRNITVGNHEERMAKMQDPELRQALRDEFDEGIMPVGITPGLEE